MRVTTSQRARKRRAPPRDLVAQKKDLVAQKKEVLQRRQARGSLALTQDAKILPRIGSQLKRERRIKGLAAQRRSGYSRSVAEPHFENREQQGQSIAFDSASRGNGTRHQHLGIIRYG